MTGGGERAALVTGIGLVSSLGEGVDTHWAALSAGAKPVVDGDRFAPWPVHPLAEVDYAAQIPGRGDRRQMGPWQLLGTYAAGLALADAGLHDDKAAKSAMHLLVAAGVGERDHESDGAIIAAAEGTGALDDTRLNTLMMDTLRPTLFLAQLSNLLAGNISIVHGVTGSSRTLLGEEMAGVSAVEHAVKRIASGQEGAFLVGGAYVAELAEQLVLMVIGQRHWQGPHKPVWDRVQGKGGAVTGSVGAFIVIESAGHAAARNARAYARIGAVASGRGPVGEPIAEVTAALAPGPLLVLSGASGIEPQTGQERQALGGLAGRGVAPAVRAFGSVLGHSIEAHFPAGVALAAIAAFRGAPYDPFDATGFEEPMAGQPGSVLVTTTGQWRGSGAAIVGPAGN